MKVIKGRDKYRKSPIIDSGSDLIFRKVWSVNGKIMSTNPKTNLTRVDYELAISTSDVKKIFPNDMFAIN